MHGLTIGAFHCGWEVSYMPSYRKLFRTFVFVAVMGTVTAYIATVEGDWRLLASFLVAMLLIFGIDGFEIQVGSFYLKVPGEVEYGQSPKDDDS